MALRGRTAYLYTPPETVRYEKTVSAAARSACARPAAGPVELEIALYFSPRALVYAKGGARRRGTVPDLDNCIKSIVDGLNGAAYLDDRQVVRILAEKRCAPSALDERAEITLRPAAPAGPEELG